MIDKVVFYTKLTFVIFALALFGLSMCDLRGYAAIAAIGLCIDMAVMGILIIYEEMT